MSVSWRTPDVVVSRGGEPDAADVRAAVARRGFAIVRGLDVTRARPLEGFAGVERVIGVRPEMAEVQVLRPIPGARSFAASSVLTPLHTDSQDFLGVAPALQVLAAVRPAERGGETTLLDTHGLLAAIERDDPGLATALFATSRAFRFYFGALQCPTFALKRGHVVVTHSPMRASPGADAVGEAWQRWVDAAAPHVVQLVAGDVLVVDNHRMLHGRRAFADPERYLVRTLAWLAEPLADAPSVRSRAITHARPDVAEPTASPRALRAVIDLVAGVSPARIAAREGVPEATVYAWRSRAFEAAARALADDEVT